MVILPIHYLFANYRIKQNHLITQIASLPVKITEHIIFAYHQENTFINGLLCSLDYNDNNPIILDATQGELAIQFIDQIENRIITTFYTKSLLFQQCYNYLYKTILRDYYHFDFYDNKLDDTKIEYAFLYEIIKSESDVIKHNFTPLNDNHIATLTLIFRHHVLKNKLFGRNQKNIVIVTNSAREKANFFAELLEYYVDVKIVDMLHINELYRLNQYKFDYLITFSNRISTILKEKSYPVIKLLST